MARAAVKAKQAQRAGAQPAKQAPRRGRKRGHRGGGNPNQQLFFMRLRRQAKFAYVILAVLFALTFAFVGVGSGTSGLDQLFSGLNIFGHHSGISVSKAQSEVQKNPKSAKAYRDLATAFETDGKTNSAIGALQQYTQLKPKSVAAWNELASLQLTLAQNYATQYQDASSQQQLAAPSQALLPTGTLGKAIGTNPIEQAASQQLNSTTSALYQQAISAYGNAVSSYKTVAKLQPDNANAQFQLAQAAQSSGDTTTAIAAYKQYLKLNPGASTAAQIRQLIKQLAAPSPTATATGTSGNKKTSSKKK
jgi:tetratricopeptide (TPR) repeat protein